MIFGKFSSPVRNVIYPHPVSGWVIAIARVGIYHLLPDGRISEISGYSSHVRRGSMDGGDKLSFWSEATTPESESGLRYFTASGITDKESEGLPHAEMEFIFSLVVDDAIKEFLGISKDCFGFVVVYPDKTSKLFSLPHHGQGVFIERGVCFAADGNSVVLIGEDTFIILDL